LGVDPAFLGVADLAQVVFLLGLEVQDRDVVEHQRHVAGGQGLGEAGRGDLVAIPTLGAAGQGAAHRLLTGRLLPQVIEDSADVENRGGFDDPGDHQVAEHRIAHDTESEVVVDPSRGCRTAAVRRSPAPAS
jgi:hypothetical protein